METSFQDHSNQPLHPAERLDTVVTSGCCTLKPNGQKELEESAERPATMREMVNQIFGPSQKFITLKFLTRKFPDIQDGQMLV